MTIASAFNEIAVAQGGAASKTGSITGAIDALNDALAGSDQKGAETIEDAVRLLGDHIGGGSSVTVEALTATENKIYTAPSGKAYSPVTVNVSGGSSSAKAYFLNPGESPTYPEVEVDGVETELVDDVLEMGGEQMPCKSVTAVIGSIIGFSLVGMEILACATATSDTSMDIPYTAGSGIGTIVLPHESAFVAFTVS